MATRALDVLRVTYSPAGQEPVSIETYRLPKRLRPDETTRRDAQFIAETVMKLKPGISEFDTSDIHIERIHEGTDRMLYHWQPKAEKAFQKERDALTHNTPLHAPELQGLRIAAQQEGVEMQERNRRKRHADPIFVPGRQRARFTAWNPVFSTTKTERGLSAFANYALKDVDVHGKSRHFDNPFLTPGLGKDDRDMVHELGPDKSIEQMQEYLSGLLRRFQDRELDPADIVHGIGKTLVDIVEEHQSGLSGVFLTLAEAELPIVREAIEVIFNLESLTSADKGGSKFALVAYSEAENRAFKRKVAKRNPNQQTHEQILEENPSLAERTLAHVEEQLRAQFDWTPKAIGRRLQEVMTTAGHRLIWYPTNVFEDQLDRRSERQDEVAMAYVNAVLTATGGSEAFKSYQRALATAFANALTAPRTDTEIINRNLSGESSAVAQMLEQELMDKIPPYWQDVIRRGLAALEGKKATLPTDYKASLTILKEHETNDSYLDYMKFLYPLTVQYSTDNASNPLAGKDKRLRKLRELWRQAREYTEFINGAVIAAHNVLVPNTLNSGVAQQSPEQSETSESVEGNPLDLAAVKILELEGYDNLTDEQRIIVQNEIARKYGFTDRQAVFQALDKRPIENRIVNEISDDDIIKANVLLGCIKVRQPNYGSGFDYPAMRNRIARLYQVERADELENELERRGLSNGVIEALARILNANVARDNETGAIVPYPSL